MTFEDSINETINKELKPCPICGKKIMKSDMYIPEIDWVPTYYDPDSGGEPISINCKCGRCFCTGTYDWKEFMKSWNKRRIKTLEEINEDIGRIIPLDKEALSVKLGVLEIINDHIRKEYE